MGVEEKGNLGKILDTGARAFWETKSKGLSERKKQRETLVYIVIVTGLLMLYQVIKQIPRNMCWLWMKLMEWQAMKTGEECK